MKNLSKLSFLIIFLSLFISTSALAVTPPVEETTPTQATVLATVNIYNAKIVSQEGNNIKISFDIANREIIQTGIRYGIQLIKETDGKESIVDEYTYDESLTLQENSRIKKEILYTVPSQLSGDYYIVIVSKNSSGFPFAYDKMEKITLTSSTKGLQILTDSCSLSLNDKDITKDMVTGFSLKNTDKLSLGCDVMNSSDKDIEAIPTFDTRYGSAYGEVVSVPASTSINFKKLEKKNFSVLIPVESLKPQMYNTSMFFKFGDIVSNKVIMNYSIDGARATIFNLSLDKKSYLKGDIAEISIYGKFYSDLIVKNEKGEEIPPTMTVTTSITSGNNRKCSATEEKTISSVNSSPALIIPIKITRDCVSPQVSISVKDSNGVVLATQMFSFNTYEAENKNISKWLLISIAILVLLILFAYILLKKKKTTNIDDNNSSSTNTIPPVASLLLFITLFSLFSLTSTKVVSADTVALGSSYGSALATYNIDSDNYNKGGTMTITASFTYDYTLTNFGNSERIHSISNYRLPTYLMSVEGTTVKNDIINDYHNMSGTWTVSTAPGNYNAKFVFVSSCPTDYRLDSFGLCYNINAAINTVIVPMKTTFSIPKADLVEEGDTFTLTMFGISRSVVAGRQDDGNFIMSRFEILLEGALSPWKGKQYSTAGTGYVNGIYEVSITEIDTTQPTLTGKNTLNAKTTVNKLIPYTVKSGPTVTVKANDANPLKVSSTTPVNITWTSTNATSCICTYNKDANAPYYSCTPEYPSTGAGSNVPALGSPFTLTQSKTFNVTCTDVPYCHSPGLTAFGTNDPSCTNIKEPSFCGSTSDCYWY